MTVVFVIVYPITYYCIINIIILCLLSGCLGGGGGGGCHWGTVRISEADTGFSKKVGRGLSQVWIFHT